MHKFFLTVMQLQRYLLALTLLLIVGCSSSVRAPFAVPEEESALAAAPSGPLASLELKIAARAEASAVQTDEIGPLSGFKLLNRSQDALRWRLALIDSATQSIDTQYYLFYGDNSGLILTSRLLAAADRGVKVRVIIDDIGTIALSTMQEKLRDTMGALMIAHPNISLRLFNSSHNRRGLGRGWDYARDFEQFNHRMHNKSLTADNRATIVGGRNIGDEYMGLSSHLNFRDIDVMGIGPIARQATAVFDLFWNSGWVIPPSQSVVEKAEAIAPARRESVEQELRRAKELERFSLTPREWGAEFATLLPSLHLGTSEVLTDRPGPDGISSDIYDWITTTVAEAKTEVLISNAYLIPQKSGVEMIGELSASGVEVTIHTNSLASHDVPAVNSHYKAWRKPLLQSGASLYEARHDAQIKASVVDTPPISARYMGLHSKSMVIDRRFSVIGSYNFDPRSALLNSEMVAMIDSPGLAGELKQAILSDIDLANSWEVSLNDAGDLEWRNDVEVTERQPSRDGFQRIADWFFTLFPKRLY